MSAVSRIAMTKVPATMKSLLSSNLLGAGAAR
jgi:hypothetical protein